MISGISVATSGKTSRNVNIERILNLLRNEGPTSQASIARKVGISPATVNNVIQQLRLKGIAEYEWVNGREALVSLISRSGAIVVVVISVESIHATLFNFDLQKRLDLNLKTNVHTGIENSPQTVHSMVHELAVNAGLTISTLSGVAVSIPAPLERKRGIIAHWATVRLPLWKDVPVKRELEKRLLLSVYVDNDANLAAYAEWMWGAGRGAECFLYLSCAQQIGSGLIIEGKIYHGANGMAGELGHLVVDGSGSVCHCGNRGCLSTLISEHAILRALKLSGNVKPSLLEVIRSANEGNASCQRLLYEAGHHLGLVLANTAKIIAPSIVAIGGELGTAWPFIKDSLYAATVANNLDKVSPYIEFVPGLLLNDVVTLGSVAALKSMQGQGISELPDWMFREADTN